MGNIYIGNNKIKNITIGNNGIKKVYIGSNLIWSSFFMPTYTGQYAIFGNELQGRIECYSSGTITLSGGKNYDIFAVGGGAGGGTRPKYRGGGSGYTSTIKNQNIYGNYSISIGQGSTPGNIAGDTSVLSILTAKGAYILNGTSSNGLYIKDGGSGGGYCMSTSTTNNHPNHPGYHGGSDGSDSFTMSESDFYYDRGLGQGITTRAFGEHNNTLYAGGGGGGYWETKTYACIGGNGGSGGGGNGANGTNSSNIINSTAGLPNTGSGGGAGGAYGYTGNIRNSSNGGSGLVIIRWGY